MLQNRTVKEILWGYKDPFLNKVPFPLDPVLGVFYPVSETIEELMIQLQFCEWKLRLLLWGGKTWQYFCYPFLCLLQYNGTSDGLYRVYTGKEDISKTAIIESYKNKRYHDVIYMKKCRYFQGAVFKTCLTKSYN